jgi:integrase
MASVYKPAGRHIYKIEFRDQHGRTRTISSGTDDEKIAKSLATKIEEDADRLRVGMAPRHPDETGPYLGLVQFKRRRATLTEAIDLYLADLARIRRRPGTIRHRRYKLRRLASQAGWGCLADITAESLTRHLAALAQAGRSAGTLNAYHDSLNAFLEWCVSQSWLHANPISRVRRSAGGADRPHRRRAFTAEELRQLLAAAGSHHARYLVAALTGLRARELSLVEKRDFDLERGVWTCRPEVDKTGQTWRLPLLPDLVPTLAVLCAALPEPTSRLFAHRLGNGTLDGHLRRAKITKVDAEARRLNFHSLRYFFCGLVARALPIQQVKGLMRHKDIRRTVNLYLDLGLDDLAQATIKLPPLFHPQVPAASETWDDWQI